MNNHALDRFNRSICLISIIMTCCTYGFIAINFSFARNSFLCVVILMLAALIVNWNSFEFDTLSAAVCCAFIVDVVVSLINGSYKYAFFRDLFYITVLPIFIIPLLIVTRKRLLYAKYSTLLSLVIGSAFIVWQSACYGLRTDYIFGMGFQLYSFLAVIILPVVYVTIAEEKGKWRKILWYSILLLIVIG